MPRACAAIVMRVWSRVRRAILNPSPSSPTSREAGIAQSSKYSSRVGEPLMPSLCSGAPKREPGVPVLQHEGRDPVRARVRVGDGHHRVVLRHPGVGDPALHAVQHVAVARAHRPGLHGRRVRARLGLGQRVGEHRLAARDRRQVGGLDLFGRAEQQRHGAQLVHRRDERGRRAGPGHLLDHDRGGDRVGPRAAVGLGDVHGLQVGLDQSLVDVPGELAGPVDLGGPGSDLVVGQGADRLAERLVLFGQGKRGEIKAHALMVDRLSAGLGRLMA